MATYVNDLRLKEIATGDEDGTWGTSTNTNLSLIADAFGLGTKQMAADADETFTMPDATADGTRALYLKITSAVSLTATRTVTLGPNTVSKTWIIENATTGSQTITIKQGTGATVNVASGSKVIVVTDGAGAGAAVFNANPTEVGGTVTSVAVSGGTTGLTTSGGPVTTSGTITLAGTLAVANGGTGQTSYTNGQLLIGNTTGNTLTKATLTAGAGVVVTNGTGTITVSGTNSDYTNLGDVSGTVNIDCTKGVVRARLTGNTTFAFTSVPSAGTVVAVTLMVVQDGTGGRTITWPASSDYPGGVVPPATTTANAVDIWTLFTIDGGTTMYVSLAMKDAK